MEIKGSRLTIRFCEAMGDGSESEISQLPSWQESMKHFKAAQHMRLEASFVARAQKLANTLQLRSPDHWSTEGELPDGKNFYAIKPHKKLRAYGWYSSRHKGVFYVSHFKFKNYQKLADEDITAVCGNWRRIEEEK